MFASGWIIVGRGGRSSKDIVRSQGSWRFRAMVAADPVFRSRRLGHVNLFVDDVDRSTRFYNDVCGLALEFRELGLRASFMGTGHTPHDLGMIETTKGKDRYG